MFSYRRVNILSLDELHRTVKLHHIIEDQVNHRNIRESVDDIITSLNLSPLTNDELLSGMSKFTSSYDDEY